MEDHALISLRLLPSLLPELEKDPAVVENVLELGARIWTPSGLCDFAWPGGWDDYRALSRGGVQA